MEALFRGVLYETPQTESDPPSSASPKIDAVMDLSCGGNKTEVSLGFYIFDELDMMNCCLLNFHSCRTRIEQNITSHTHNVHQTADQHLCSGRGDDGVHQATASSRVP
jgi:hypothetical protein